MPKLPMRVGGTLVYDDRPEILAGITEHMFLSYRDELTGKRSMPKNYDVHFSPARGRYGRPKTVPDAVVHVKEVMHLSTFKASRRVSLAGSCTIANRVVPSGSVAMQCRARTLLA